MELKIGTLINKMKFFTYKESYSNGLVFTFQDCFLNLHIGDFVRGSHFDKIEFDVSTCELKFYSEDFVMMKRSLIIDDISFDN